MGKIHFELRGAAIATHRIGIGYNGIQFDKIQQIINSLPGKTTIVKIEELPTTAFSRVWLVDAENDSFIDGTEIVPKYKTSLQNNGTYRIEFFDGIDIVDPPAQQAQAASPGTSGIGFTVPPNGSGTFNYKASYGSGPYNYKVSHGFSTASTTPAQVPLSVTIDSKAKEILKSNTTECECGKEKHGFASHSDWCKAK